MALVCARKRKKGLYSCNCFSVSDSCAPLELSKMLIIILHNYGTASKLSICFREHAVPFRNLASASVLQVQG